MPLLIPPSTPPPLLGRKTDRLAGKNRRVIIGGTFALGHREAVTEFDTFDRRNGKEDGSDTRFNAIEDRIANASRQTDNHRFDNAAD